MATVLTMDEVRKSYIRWAIEAYTDNQDEYMKYEDYYDGEHELQFSTERWRRAFGNEFEEFADNWVQVVVDAPAQRLEITGWDCDDKSALKPAEELWDTRFVDQEEDDLHLQTFLKGDGYLMVWPSQESDTPVDLLYHDALEVNVFYDFEDRRKISKASKMWIGEDAKVYINIYYDDKIDKYHSRRGREDVSLLDIQEKILFADETVPGDWIKYASVNHGYGRVPFFHFKNRGAGSTHGLSEIKPVIPLQNGVNKMMMDILLGSEFSGFPQKWMAGGGQPSGGWKAGPERIFASSDPQAKFGQFDQMEFDGPRNVVEMIVAHIAKITSTPMHYLRSSGDMPSGEALKTAEAGLVSKVLNRQKRWRHPWGEAMTFAIAVKRVRENGGTVTPEAIRAAYPKKILRPVWKSPETRHDLEQAQTAQLKSILGVPLRQIWREHFDYTEEQIIEFELDNQVVAAAALAQLLAQDGQVPPGAEVTLGEILEGTDIDVVNLAGMSIPQLLAQLKKSQTARTTAGEATTNPQPNTAPPASPTRRSSGFRD